MMYNAALELSELFKFKVCDLGNYHAEDIQWCWYKILRFNDIVCTSQLNVSQNWIYLTAGVLVSHNWVYLMSWTQTLLFNDNQTTPWKDKNDMLTCWMNNSALPSATWLGYQSQYHVLWVCILQK